MSEMKRWNYGGEWGMDEEDNGEYVLYADHAETVVQRELERSREMSELALKCDMLRDRADSATERNKQLLARCHALEAKLCAIDIIDTRTPDGRYLCEHCGGTGDVRNAVKEWG